MSGTYRVTNTLTKKYYVGSSKNLYSRLSRHARLLVDGKHFNKHLQSSWNKYGYEHFNVSIALCDDYLELEQLLLDAANDDIDSGTCYNIAKVVGPPSTQQCELHSQASLTNAQVTEIKRLINQGATMQHLVSAFGVSRNTIWSIKSGRTWSEVSSELNSLIADVDFTCRGSSVHSAKLTSTDIEAIISLLNTMPQKEIALLYNVSPSRISEIKNSRTWKHLCTPHTLADSNDRQDGDDYSERYSPNEKGAYG